MKLTLYYKQLDSTQSEYTRLSRALGQGHGLHIRAGIQTKGRGREGNSWSSILGGLWFSVNLQHSKPIASMPLYVGYIVHRTLQSLFPLRDLSIKWPNDIYLGSAKLAGILCEYNPGESNYLIGLGINTNNDIDNATHEYQAANISDIIGMEVSNTILSRLLTRELRVHLQLLETPASYLDYCNKHLYGSEMPASIVQGKETIEGIIDGITPQGYLRLKDTHGNIREIISGTLRLI